MLGIVLLIIQVAAVLFAAYTGRRKLKRLINDTQVNTEVESANEDLPDIDKAILKLLAERQGVVYQSEIIKELGLPKSTVHKALRRLSDGGYVEIQKRGRLNVVILKKPTSTALTT